MIDPAHPFARATWDLLMVMHDRQLPPPMSLNWNPFASVLYVQVLGSDYLRYLDALVSAEQTVTQRDGRSHYKAAGTLRGAPETHIHLTAILQPERVVA